MARSNPRVWLGYEDECITDKHKDHVNFTTNKIGGKPDFPNGTNIEVPICPLCQLPTLLVVQIYAPLENSTYHRTLYLFGCINSNCWGHNESWTCLRSQALEQIETLKSVVPTSYTNSIDWCVDADYWDDDNNANINEENGNVISSVEKVSDEDDESCSFEEYVHIQFGNLRVDDKNANTGIIDEAQGAGAMGKLNSPAATAEIEGDEGEVISIDTPTIPERDIVSLLQETLPLPEEIYKNSQSNMERHSTLHFVPLFMSAWEETRNISNISDHHVRELLQEYQQTNEIALNMLSADNYCDLAAATDIAIEKYEKSNPVHGDKMFHHFLTKIQMNSGQILRYSRDGASPLLLYPMQDVPRKCQYCQGEMVFEFQILPTLIPKLKLMNDDGEGARIEFGTVLIFTCRRSCWSKDAVIQQEAVIVQAEIY